MALYILLGLLWVAAIFRAARSWQKPHAASLRAIAIGMTVMAAGITMNMPFLAHPVDRLFGWPNTAALFKQVGVAVAACGNHVMLLYLKIEPGEPPPAPRRVRLRWLTAAIVIAASGVLFFTGGRHEESADFAFTYAGTAWLSESRLVVMLYAAVILTLVARLCFRHWNSTALGRGVLVTGTGASLLLVYCLLRVVYLGGHRLGVAVPEGLYRLGTDIDRAGLPLLAIGTLLPAFEGWLRARRDLRLLGPLERCLGSAITLVDIGELPRHTELPLVVDRRVVRIQDALYILGEQAGLSSHEPSSERDPRTDATSIARWLHSDGGSLPSLWTLTTPPPLTDRQWCLLLAEMLRTPPVQPLAAPVAAQR